MLQSEPFWSFSAQHVADQLQSTPFGLTSQEASRRLQAFGPNVLRERSDLTRFAVFVNQLRNPLLTLLAFAAVVSMVTGGWSDSLIVIAILAASVGIGYSREYRAQVAAADLRRRIQVTTTVFRNGQSKRVPLRDVVPGDLVLLSAGSLVPADGLLLQTNDLQVDEAVLTGESFPVEKNPGVVALESSLSERTNCVFLGTSVRSGTGRYLVVSTGVSTQFGAVAHRLSIRPPENDFDRSIRRFGYLLAVTMFILTLLVFAANILLGKPPVETLLFSVALAVGLSPELLPAILNVNLARGAQMMARQGVIVRRLSSIENLGSMNILCTDKTGTLTEGAVRLEGAYGIDARHSFEVLNWGGINSALQTGLANPLDQAILKSVSLILSKVTKIDELPYDFVRKRLSVIVDMDGSVLLITKGAFAEVLSICTRLPDGTSLTFEKVKLLEEQFRSWAEKGVRVLAVATRELPRKKSYDRTDELDLVFRGFLAFKDPPKEGVDRAISGLRNLGVAVKVITGDSGLVAKHVAKSVGLPADRVLTGKNLDEIHDEALWRIAESTDLFVEVDPNQKERIIRALKKMGHVVGFMGDGINDVPAMHAADTSISVDQAVDVARETADFILVERHLDVIRRGIEEGRRTFANTLKYILATMSANLGNMLSMAIASMFLSFLPLLASQILLNNFLSDLPAIGLADDRVDVERVKAPGRWNMGFIGRFMIEFGLLSSFFDFVTFGTLLWGFSASPELFRTGWFVESVLTEIVIALIIRTRRTFYQSRPGPLLIKLTAGVAGVALAISYLPFNRLLGFEPLSFGILISIIGITLLYAITTEVAKKRFRWES